MKKIFYKSLLLILLAFGGINAAFANYSDADSYDGYFQYQRVKLTLDDFWISWRFPNYDYDGTDDALKYSRWYVGGNAASLTTYNTNPGHYFFYPFDQGTEILYMDRTYRIGQRQNGSHGGGEVYNENRSGDIRTHDVKFYPGENMGPTQMAAFFVRWTGVWDTDDNGWGSNAKEKKDYWIGQEKGNMGSSTDGAYWQGSGVRHKGNGIARYTKITYEIPGTNAATFTRKPGGKIEASISGNDHGSWNEYYGFSDGTAVDGRGYYINEYGTVQLPSGGKYTYTLNGTFDETQNYTIYYHQFYKRDKIIKGQGSGWEDAGDKPIEITQRAQASIIYKVVQGFIYPSNLQVTQNKWDKTVKLTWTINNNDSNHDKDGGWLVFRQKVGEGGYTLLTPSRLNNSNNSYTDTDIETGAEYTYWVTFAPTVYGNITAPISSKLSCSTKTKHDNTFSFKNVTGESVEAEAGIVLTWTPEREASDVSFIIQRWNERSEAWEDLNTVAQNQPRYVDKEVVSWYEYKYRIKTSYWGLDFYSEDFTICHTLMTKVNEIMASQGAYSNMVKLNWNVTLVGQGQTRYILSRKLLGDPKAVFTKVYEMIGTESTFYYEDGSALPGQFYSYKITPFAMNPNTQKWVEGTSKETEGFVQSRGIVSGRIKYDTGTAVQGAKVILTKSDNSDDDNTTKQFYSLHFNSNSNDGIEWAPSDEIIKNYLAGDNPWTVQFHVRPESGQRGKMHLVNLNGCARFGLQRRNNQVGYYDFYADLYNSFTGKVVSKYPTDVKLPVDEYSHVVIQYDGNNVYRIRVLRPGDEKIVSTLFLDSTNPKFGEESDTLTRKITFGGGDIGGNIDEIRIWTKLLSDDEIMSNYNRILNGSESGLLCYWPLDEGIQGLKSVYDYSKTKGVPNGNHATLKGNALISEIVPDEDKLSIYGITDVNGNYTIRGVPFSGDGTTYIVRPVLGIHEFSPSFHTRYVSSNSLTHDDISFEDVSSFPVSGTVYYENTTFPVQGCTFSIDGNPCSKDGKLIETDEFGRFEISVPIGDHHITIKKNGHTFVGEGRYPAGVDTKFTFDREVTNLTFYDNTLVNVAGRIVGGNIEGNKSIGFGLSTNNIGKAQIVLTPTNDLYSLNVKKVEDGTSFYFENNTDSLVCESSSSLVNSTSWRGKGDNAGRIYINTDAETGEFSAMVPPILYNVSAPVVIKTTQTVGTAGIVDLSDPMITSSDTIVSPETGAEMTFEYNAKHICVYHSEPTFTVTQVDFENGAFGIAEYEVEDQVGKFNVGIVNKEGKPVYAYGTPMFIQGDPYTFKLKGYEQYTNYDNGEETTVVPLENCIVTISNALSDGQAVLAQVEEGNEDYKVGEVVDLESNQVELDVNGEATYTWKAGFPNITAPYTRTISISYEIDGQENLWKYNEQEFMEGIILGALPSGNNFITSGPDKLQMILRDPPGSGSSAEWSSGTVTSREKHTGHCWNSETTIKLITNTGIENTVLTGTGVAIKNTTHVINEVEGGSKVTTEGENSKTIKQEWSITEAISTSDDPSFVGSYGDIFIGNSTNIVFGPLG